MRVLGKSLCLDGQQRRQPAPPPAADKASPLDAAAVSLMASPVSRDPDDEVSKQPPPLPPRNRQERSLSTKRILWLVIGGGLSLLFGCLSLIWTPFDIMMNERLKMMPGLPPFEWWKTPPDEVLLRVRVFNITNSEEFMAGDDDKLKVDEIGPYVYLERLRHHNVTHHDNNTMTYTGVRSPHWLPEKNTLSLNDTIIVPNIAVLGIASYLQDTSFFIKWGYNILMRRLDSQPFVKTTVYNYFWNFTDPVLHFAQTIVPNLVPVTNIGILHMIYSDFRDNVTVFIGPENARRFFTMDQFHGSPRFGYWSGEKCDAVAGATEGVVYPQYLTKNDTLKYFRKTICRITPIYYTGDVTRDGVSAFRFELPGETYDRPANPEEECYRAPGTPLLPSGLTDISPCYHDFPIAASHPHFYSAETKLLDAVEGLTPNKELHGSFAVVEPITGIPMESCARSQSNLIVRRLSGMPKLQRFSDLAVPMFWAEYHQVSLPGYIYYLMYFTVNILPELQLWMSFFMTTLGGSAFILGVTAVIFNRRRTTHKPKCAYSSLDLMPSTSSSEC
ncbi:scavenger receptor class B member 1-like [Schistocerca cancellata]|uniref:scavenger receptor class B member 1-like n=1 Tax=Schistocerca cancellata TaxID=274614 RepID=UPI002119AA1C|nr:scavenger receptor class B member 1-like [Schistocerca cancellata]